MADARITELTSAAWSSGLTFAVVDAGTTKRIGSDQFGLTTTAQANTVANAAIVSYGAVTTAQASAIADDAANALLSSISVVTSAIGDLSTGSGTAVSAAVSKDEVIIVVSGISTDSGNDTIYVQLTSNGGSSYIVTGYRWWLGVAAAAGTLVAESPASSAGWDLTATGGTDGVFESGDTYNYVLTLKGLQGTSANMKKTIVMNGFVTDGGQTGALTGAGYLDNTSAINGVRVVAVGGNFDAGSVTFMQR